MSWFSDHVWPGPVVTAMQRNLAQLAQQQHKILEEIKTMAAREDAAYEALNANINTVREGWAALVASNAAKDARIAELEAALQNADAEAAAELEAAMAADSDADAAKVEAASAALDDLVAPPVEPAPNQPA